MPRDIAVRAAVTSATIPAWIGAGESKPTLALPEVFYK